MPEVKKESPHKGKWISMNLDCGGFRKGERFFYDDAPNIIKIWANLPGMLGETLIVTVSDDKPPEKEAHIPYTCEKCGHVEGQPLKKAKTISELNQERIDAAERREKDDTTVYCKGLKVGGEPCNRTKLVEGTDFCFQHQLK